MNVVDKNLEDLKKESKKNQNQQSYSEPDEVEMMMEKPVKYPLNTSKNVFDKDITKQFGGINSEQSIFERTAIFHVSNEK